MWKCAASPPRPRLALAARLLLLPLLLPRFASPLAGGREGVCVRDRERWSGQATGLLGDSSISETEPASQMDHGPLARVGEGRDEKAKSGPD